MRLCKKVVPVLTQEGRDVSVKAFFGTMKHIRLKMGKGVLFSKIFF